MIGLDLHRHTQDVIRVKPQRRGKSHIYYLEWETCRISVAFKAFEERARCTINSFLGTAAIVTLSFQHIGGPLAVAYAAAPPPITSSGLNTQISPPTQLPPGQTSYSITGGTRPGGGTNLFHSFGNFNVPNNNIANFLNESGAATSNILGRVTGGNPSNIFGTIQTRALVTRIYL